MDNEDTYKFLRLLKRLESSELELIIFIPIIEEEWWAVVKKSKMRSVWLIFSK